jgi:hypothetical protein
MYASELRTCGLGAVVAVLLGAGIGVGWDYFADSAGATTAISSVTRPVQENVPSAQLSCPPGSREGRVADVPLPNSQADTTQARGALGVTHAAHAKRARQMPPSG